MLSMMKYHRPLLKSLNKLKCCPRNSFTRMTQDTSNLNYSALDKKQGDQTQFSP